MIPKNMNEGIFFKKTFNQKKSSSLQRILILRSVFFITVNKIVLWMVWQALQIIIHKPILATALNLLDSMEIVQDQIRKLQKEIYVLHHRQEDNRTEVIFRRLLLVKVLWIYGQNTQIAKYVVGGTQKPFSFTDTHFFLIFSESIFLCI